MGFALFENACWVGPRVERDDNEESVMGHLIPQVEGKGIPHLKVKKTISSIYSVLFPYYPIWILGNRLMRRIDFPTCKQAILDIK